MAYLGLVLYISHYWTHNPIHGSNMDVLDSLFSFTVNEKRPSYASYFINVLWIRKTMYTIMLKHVFNLNDTYIVLIQFMYIGESITVVYYMKPV